MVRRPSTGTDRYSTVAIAFHWTIAAGVLLNLWIGIVGGSFAIHKAVGITILALTIGRVAWRLAHRPPPLPPTVPGWQRGLAHATHWSLYALLLLMPLSGWAMASGGAVRRPLSWFGLFDIPYLPVSPAGASAAHEGHEVLGYAMLALVALHVAGALYHQLIVRDRTLARMAPVLDR
jgi:cytochrome b561